jgi:hypothetical protein
LKKYFIFLLPILLFSKAVKVEEILSDKNQIRLDTALTYTNINQKSGSLALFNYQTSAGDFVSVPTFTGENITDRDLINYSVNLRYGLTKKLEIFSYVSAFSDFTKTSSNGEFKTEKENEFSTFGIGAIYQIRKEDNYPSVLVGGSTQAINRVETENNKEENSNFKSNSIFISSYYTTDQIVFFLKSYFQKNEEFRNIQNGDILSLKYQTYFAVNPYTSLSFGFNYSHQGKSKRDGETFSNSSSTLTYMFGTSYEINFKSVIFLEMNFSDNSLYSQDSISVNYSYKF